MVQRASGTKFRFSSFDDVEIDSFSCTAFKARVVIAPNGFDNVRKAGRRMRSQELGMRWAARCLELERESRRSYHVASIVCDGLGRPLTGRRVEFSINRVTIGTATKTTRNMNGSNPCATA